MFYIRAEFQALPISLRFPLQKFLTVNFSARETTLRRDEHRVFLRRGGTGGEHCLRTFHCFQVLALPFSHETQRNPGGEKKAVTHGL